MAIFANHSKTGKGVSKTAKKKPFFKFFEIFLNKFWDLIYLNFIYIIFCIPIVTIGPATAALTSICRNFYLEKPVFIFHDFFNAFKKNFKTSIIVGVVDVMLVTGFIFAAMHYIARYDTGDYSWLLLAMLIAGGAIVSMVHFYIYLQIVALNLKMPSIIKNSVYLTFLGVFPNIITLLVCVAIITIMVLLLPWSMFFIPILPAAIMAFVIVFNSYPMIQKFIINPYYEARGEKNPEIPDETDGERIFTDMGGKEEVYTGKPKASGKVIK